MRITVLGKSPAWQDPGGACSGYLVEAGGRCLLLDCGNGVFAKLRAARAFTDVCAVVISHLHADHFMDLIPYAYALAYSHQARAAGSRPQLHVPPGGRETLRRITGAWQAEELIEQSFEVHEYDPAAELALDPLRVRFHEVPHFIRTHAVQVSAGGASFTYGADCRPNDAIVQLARDTDLLMLEATLEQPEGEQQRGHLTPAEAGEHARRAAARRLVLTHISADHDAAWAVGEAEREFGGPVELAREGAVYEI
ncbi:MAG: MBL fold metallo-hydrolase [Actinobacteria bacterium]|nr:MBL fold metallo-hydrolase [Actinomycetota bacterium]